MTAYRICHYCQTTFVQHGTSLQGVGDFCSRQCARVYVTLHPSSEPAFEPALIYSFKNPPPEFRVTALRRVDALVERDVIAESPHEGHAIRMASAYPSRAVVTNRHGKAVFDNGKVMSGVEVA